MAKDFCISLDAMGGEDAPRKVVAGAARALESYPSLTFILCGNQDALAPLLKKYPALKKVSEIHPTTSVVHDDDKPSHALRYGKTSSMRLAINAVAEGKAGAVVSSGNTGAYMAMAKFVLNTYPAIDRPAIATLIPSQTGEFVLLDLGANTTCTPENLAQFAVLGAAYVKSLLGTVQPKVALLNIGEEELKGLPLLHTAADHIRQMASPHSFDFMGFVEADVMLKGGYDVVVADGFTGNIVLKTLEGTAKLLGSYLTSAYQSSLRSKLGYLLAKPALTFLSHRINPSQYNGAIFLGLNGIAIKSHGKADALGFASAISVAVDMMHHDFKHKVSTMMATPNHDEPAP